MRISKAERDRLKAMPYSSYLKTNFWKSVRKQALTRAGNACQICNNKTRLQAHHRTYEHRGYEDKHLQDLTILCRACHKKFHAKKSKIRKSK